MQSKARSGSDSTSGGLCEVPPQSAGATSRRDDVPDSAWITHACRAFRLTPRLDVAQ
jgi:hypothetical protein